MPVGIYIRTKEHRKNIGKSLMGKNTWSKGKLLSEDTKRKISETTSGKEKSLKHKRKLSKYLTGRVSPIKGKHPWSKESRIRFSEKMRGENAPNWRGGLTPINKIIRKSLEYKLWRTVVFERDHYTCIWCGIRGGELNADHIKPFALFPELRFAIDNGRTLCVACHRTTDTWGKNLRKDQIKEMGWIKNV